MKIPLNEQALQQLFTEARTFSHWEDRPVGRELLEQLYALASLPPTAANSNPGRFVFVTSAEGKQKLATALSPGNVEKTLSAPVTVIVAQDSAFYDQLPFLFPQADARSWYVGNEALIERTAFQNGSLQGAYLMLAARALGLDCGPMGGFDNARVDELFLAGSGWKSNFLINLGYGDRSRLHPRNPRLGFATATRFA